MPNSKTSRKAISNAARPLGTPKPKGKHKASAVVTLPKENHDETVAFDPAPVVASPVVNPAGHDTPANTQKAGSIVDKTLSLKGLSKSGKYALYSGLRTVIRIATTNFPDSKPVQTFSASGEFAGPREKKPVLTAEERKAARAAKPKLTLAERIKKDEERVAKLKEKLAAQEAQGQSAGASA